MKQTPSPKIAKKHTKDDYWYRSPKAKYYILAFLVVAIIALVVWFVKADNDAKASFALVSNEITKMENDVILPAGGEQYPSGEGVFAIGDGWIDSYKQCYSVIDVHCPRVGQYWFVPVIQGSEYSFIVEALKKEGYEINATGKASCNLEATNSCIVFGKKGRLNVSLDIEKPVYHSIAPPTKDVYPKIWRTVSYYVDYFPDN